MGAAVIGNLKTTEISGAFWLARIDAALVCSLANAARIVCPITNKNTIMKKKMLTQANHFGQIK